MSPATDPIGHGRQTSPGAGERQDPEVTLSATLRLLAEDECGRSKPIGSECALLARFGPDDRAPLPVQMAVFGILYVGIATAVHGTIVILAAQLRPWLVEGPRQTAVRRILSVVLALVAIWLAWATHR